MCVYTQFAIYWLGPPNTICGVEPLKQHRNEVKSEK